MTDHELAALFLGKMVRWTRLHAARKFTDLSRGELYVLQMLTDKREAQPGDICAGLDVSTARVAALLNSMERKGWVKRFPDPADRRKIRVVITEAGEAKARDFRRGILEYVARLLRELGERDTRELMRIMDRLSELLEKDLAERGAAERDDADRDHLRKKRDGISRMNGETTE
jgi:DNA-binding MarR family transcriptional regulator